MLYLRCNFCHLRGKSSVHPSASRPNNKSSYNFYYCLMLIVYWNIRGVDRVSKRWLIIKTISDSNSPIIYLQETKLHHINVWILRSSCGAAYDEFQTLSSVGSSGGILICWTSEIIQGLPLHQGKYSIIMKFH